MGKGYEFYSKSLKELLYKYVDNFQIQYKKDTDTYCIENLYLYHAQTTESVHNRYENINNFMEKFTKSLEKNQPLKILFNDPDSKLSRSCINRLSKIENFEEDFTQLLKYCFKNIMTHIVLDNIAVNKPSAALKILKSPRDHIYSYDGQEHGEFLSTISVLNRFKIDAQQLHPVLLNYMESKHELIKLIPNNSAYLYNVTKDDHILKCIQKLLPSKYWTEYVKFFKEATLSAPEDIFDDNAKHCTVLKLSQSGLQHRYISLITETQRTFIAGEIVNILTELKQHMHIENISFKSNNDFITFYVESINDTPVDQDLMKKGMREIIDTYSQYLEAEHTFNTNVWKKYTEMIMLSLTLPESEIKAKRLKI